MNKDNLLKDDAFLRSQIRKILTEQNTRILSETDWGTDDAMYGGGPRLNVFKTLVEPFTDVFKVATIAAKDITSAVIDIADYFITFDKEKQKNIQERYRQRRKKYSDKMSKAMESTNAAFDSPDAKLLTFMAAPGYHLTKGALGLSWSAAEPVRDKVEDYFGGSLGIGDRDISASTSQDKSPGLMADLKRAFFGEGLDEVDEIELILIEQEKEKDSAEAAPSEKEVKRIADEYLESSGTNDLVNEFWDAMIEDKESEINDVLDQQKEKVELVTRLSVATSIESAAEIVQKLSTLGADLSAPFGKVKKLVNSEIEKIKAGSPESEKIIDQLKSHPDAAAFPENAPPESYYPIIEKGLLATAFGSSVEEAKKSGVSELVRFVAEMDKADLENLSKMGLRAKEYAALIFKFRDDLLRI
jgi:hypothetical protein